MLPRAAARSRAALSETASDDINALCFRTGLRPIPLLISKTGWVASARRRSRIGPPHVRILGRRTGSIETDRSFRGAPQSVRVAGGATDLVIDARSSRTAPRPFGVTHSAGTRSVHFAVIFAAIPGSGPSTEGRS
jgi:hypothetical protein